MIAEIIKFLLVNFTVTLFVLGLAAAGLRIARTRTRTAATTTGAVLDYFILFSIGVSYTWNFVVHSVFGDFSAKVIGWAQSPFQLEVAFASLGFALVGFLAFPRRRELLLKLASVLGVTPFLWGAAGGHIYQIVVNGNHAAGNAGAILWTDLLLPVFGLAAVWAHHRALTRESVAADRRRTAPEPVQPGAL
jgi:hypothetical protein